MRHLPAQGGGGATPRFFRGCSRDTGATPAKCYKIQEISCDTCSATRVARQGVPAIVESCATKHRSSGFSKKLLHAWSLCLEAYFSYKFRIDMFGGLVTSQHHLGHTCTILFKIITRIKLLFSNYLGRHSYSFRARQELISVTVKVLWVWREYVFTVTVRYSYIKNGPWKYFSKITVTVT